MRSHKFINSLLYLIIQLVVKESRANENNGGIRCFFVLFIDKRYISQVIHFKQHFRNLRLQKGVEIKPQKRQLLAQAAVKVEKYMAEQLVFLAVSKSVLRLLTQQVFCLHTKK